MSAEPARERRPLRTAAVAVAVLLATAFVALLIWGLTTTAPGTSIDESLARGEAATTPAFGLEVLGRGNLGRRLSEDLKPALADGEIDVREMRGTPFVLNFWASWCVPCREEAPLLQRRWEQARDQGVLFVGLNMQDVREDARAFLDEFGLDFLIIRDPNNTVARRYETTGIPETFFVSARGEIVGHVAGVVSRQQLDVGIAAARRGRPRPAAAGGDQRPAR